MTKLLTGVKLLTLKLINTVDIFKTALELLDELKELDQSITLLQFKDFEDLRWAVKKFIDLVNELDEVLNEVYDDYIKDIDNIELINVPEEQREQLNKWVELSDELSKLMDQADYYNPL